MTLPALSEALFKGCCISWVSGPVSRSFGHKLNLYLKASDSLSLLNLAVRLLKKSVLCNQSSDGFLILSFLLRGLAKIHIHNNKGVYYKDSGILIMDSFWIYERENKI